MKNLTKVLLSACLIIFTASAANAKDNTPKYKIEIKDHKFIPDVVEVPANTKFRLVIKNSDKTAAEFESHDLKKERVIKGGKTSTITIKALKAGEYKFVDEFHEDTTKGKIIVK